MSDDKVGYEVEETALWAAACKRRLVEFRSRADEMMADTGTPSEELQQALDDAVGSVCDLAHELFGVALNLIGARLIGGDLKPIEERMWQIRQKTEENLDKLCALVSSDKHLS